jgi:hypothetical protein
MRPLFSYYEQSHFLGQGQASTASETASLTRLFLPTRGLAKQAAVQTGARENKELRSAAFRAHYLHLLAGRISTGDLS